MKIPSMLKEKVNMFEASLLHELDSLFHSIIMDKTCISPSIEIRVEDIVFDRLSHKEELRHDDGVVHIQAVLGVSIIFAPNRESLKFTDNVVDLGGIPPPS